MLTIAEQTLTRVANPASTEKYDFALPLSFLSVKKSTKFLLEKKEYEIFGLVMLKPEPQSYHKKEKKTKI